MPEVGVEPTRPCGQRILSPPRLPFRHSGWSERPWYPARPIGQRGEQQVDAAARRHRSGTCPMATGARSLEASAHVPRGADALGPHPLLAQADGPGRAARAPARPGRAPAARRRRRDRHAPGDDQPAADQRQPGALPRQAGALDRAVPRRAWPDVVRHEVPTAAATTSATTATMPITTLTSSGSRATGSGSPLPHRPLVARPLPQRGQRDEGPERDERQPDDPPPERQRRTAAAGS